MSRALFFVLFWAEILKSRGCDQACLFPHYYTRSEYNHEAFIVYYIHVFVLLTMLQRILQLQRFFGTKLLVTSWPEHVLYS